MNVLRRLFLLGFTVVSTAGAEAPPRPVRVQAVVMTPSEQSVAYSAAIQARVQADLAFRVGGKVIERPVNLGDAVKNGQLLARLDPTDLQLSLEAALHVVAAAQAETNNAQAEFRRYKTLGRVSPAYLPAEFDKRQSVLLAAEARMAQAQRQLALAHDQLAYTELRADADGLVTALPVQLGQVVSPGQTVASLAHSKEIEAVVNVPENRLPEIRAATTVTVTLWSAPDNALRGRVREIGALADAASRTFAVRVSVLDTPPGGLALGMTATVRFAREAGAALAVLPATALVDQEGKPAVWVFDSHAGRVALRPVQLAGLSGDGTVAISSGLSGGEQVVTAGASLLRPDMPVAPWAGAVH